MQAHSGGGERLRPMTEPATDNLGVTFRHVDPFHGIG